MSTPYLLGDSDPELQRLADQHLVWSEATHNGWRTAGLAAGQRVLDVGCGPGFTTLELARLVGPSGSVTGIDPSARFMAYAENARASAGLDNVNYRLQAIDEMDRNERYDVIHVRWVLCFLADPTAAIERLAQCLAPGGRLLVLDYFNYSAFTMAPRIEAMATVVDAIGRSWETSGGSLEVQELVPAACENAGLRVTTLHQVSGIARPGEPHFMWPQSFLEGFIPKLVGDGLLDAATAEQFWNGWRERARQAGSFLYLPPILQIIARK